MKNKQKKIKLMGIISVIVLITLIILFLCIEKTAQVDYYILESRTDSVKNTKVLDSKTLGWIRVQGTNIDTPIVKVTDSVSESFDVNYLWISSYFHEDENRKVIYGHNVRNVSSEPEVGNSEHIRFEQLMSFVYYGFAKENLYIQYNDGVNDYLYKIYAVSFNDVRYEYGQSYGKKKLKEYIRDAKDISLYDYDVEVDETDELISLITCTRYFGLYGKTQFRVDARRVRENEKISKYSVEITPNYDIIK